MTPNEWMEADKRIRAMVAEILRRQRELANAAMEQPK